MLCVGKAKTSHRPWQRYLADPNEILIMSPRSGGHGLSSSLRHAGKVQLRVGVQQRYRALGHTESGIWIRWTVCSDSAPLEGQLISHLQPAFKTHGRQLPQPGCPSAPCLGTGGQGLRGCAD